MALVVKDRVQETSTTTGTGTFTLAGAVTGFQSFSVIGNANTTYYAIVGGAEWEVGLGTYTSSGTTLSRNTILESSNGGTAVNFSAGTKNVFVTYPAERALYTDASSNAIALGTPASATLTNATGLPLTTGVTGTLPIANGGTGTTSTTFTNLTTNVTGTLPVANGGTGITSLGTGVATFLGTPSSANLAAAVTDETGSGALVFATSPTLTTPALGTPSALVLTNATGLPAAALPAGSVLQVVSTNKTDTFTSAASSTWTDITGMSVSITPSSTSNKILIITTLQGTLFRPAANAVLVRLLRDSTEIGIGDAASSRARTTFGAAISSGDSICSTTINYLDSPSTTSSTTYKLQFWQDTPGNPLYINRTVVDTNGASFQRCISTITVMEIKG